MLKKLREKNNELLIYDINDQLFSKFGRVLSRKDYEEAISYIETHTTIPETGNEYVAHDDEFEKSLNNLDSYNDVFGGVKLQFGYVNGHNQMLNALEYHKSSEINIAVSPMVLMMGLSEDIKDFQYDTKNLKVFYVPAGTVVEIYPRVLHFSPCEVDETGFKCGVILPYSTNVSFLHSNSLEKTEEQLLFKTNKWLLCHEDFQKLINLGAHKGIVGKNYKISY